MDKIIKAEMVEDNLYFLTAFGDVYRIWFGGEPYPLNERLTDDQVRELEGRRFQHSKWRRY